ncbi:MAG: hypothetical protein RL329_2377, partial [Bacteroidota bacterium]
MKPPKILLIGWDAADWKIINPLIDAGLMPNLQRLMENGVVGNLATLDPAFSPMLWTTIATGKRPYKHGVLGFTEPHPNGKDVRPVQSTSRKTKTLWNVFTQCGLKSHVVGWWPSHPAEPINGISISNFYQKSIPKPDAPWFGLPKNAVYPADQAKRFSDLLITPEDHLTIADIAFFAPDHEKADEKGQQRLAAIARVTADCGSIYNAGLDILRKEEWDFAAIYFDAIDHYCHGFMKYNPPKRPHIAEHEYQLFKDVVRQGYILHDIFLGNLLAEVGDEVTVMLISDHGFQPDHLRPKRIPTEPAGPAAEHSQYGIFVLSGQGIKKDELVFGASLLDITPTILALMGLPIGEDMDGKVLTSVFETLPELDYIPSWDAIPGEAGLHTLDEADEADEADEEATQEDDQEVLKQLVDLGYIEPLDADKEKAYESTYDECQYNLARAYIDGGKLDEALPILQKLHAKDPIQGRFAFRLAAIYELKGQITEARALIQGLRDSETFDEKALDLIDASLLIGENKGREALPILKRLEGRIAPEESRLYLQLSKCYLQINRLEAAEEMLLKELAVDFDQPEAHRLLGVVRFQDGRYPEAATALLDSLALNYYQPNTHCNLGQALFYKGDYEAAAKAFEMSLRLLPELNMSRKMLVYLYDKQLNEPEKALEHARKFEEINQEQGTITIVSGLPRSGTSLMMQALHAGGLDVFVDEERPADDNNQKGYYEHQLVKKLAQNKTWLPDAVGKGVKVISHLLHHLPPRYKYKIVFMERHLFEITSSQQKMLKRLGKKGAKDSETFNAPLYVKFEQ